MDPSSIYSLVQEQYGAQADAVDKANGAEAEKVATAFGYSLEELQSIPKDANLGVSCGNPLATAKLNQGEVVLDLGSGGGIDVILAGGKVGPTGKVIGVDMNKKMLDLARRNVQNAGVSNASFLESSITSISLPPQTVDCVISNCVINLVPDADKPKVFQEIFRLLKPGGRLAVSDILARAELPPDIRQDAALYVGCVAGASRVGEYQRFLEDAGFEGILIVDTQSDINVYKNSAAANDGTSGCCSGAAEVNKLPNELSDLDLNDWVGSYQIFATKSPKAV